MSCVYFIGIQTWFTMVLKYILYINPQNKSSFRVVWVKLVSIYTTLRFKRWLTSLANYYKVCRIKLFFYFIFNTIQNYWNSPQTNEWRMSNKCEYNVNNPEKSCHKTEIQQTERPNYQLIKSLLVLIYNISPILIVNYPVKPQK